MISMKGTVMKNKPLLSVIVPVYNGETHLEETIESIKQSGYSNLEILLIDDGSSDNSSKICKKLAEKDRRIRYVQKENEGIAATRNYGLQLALGEFVCFCDQDDAVVENAYNMIMEQLVKTSADMAICSTARLIGSRKVLYEKMSNGHYLGPEIKSKLLYPLLFRGYQYSFMDSTNYFYGTIWKCIFNKKFIMKQKINFFCFVNYEDDWLFCVRALVFARNVVTIRKVGYYWRYDSNSKSHRREHIENFIPKLRALEYYITELLLEGGIPQNIVEEYRNVLFCQNLQALFDNHVLLCNHKKLKREKEMSWLQIRQYLEEKKCSERFACFDKLHSCAIRRRILYALLRRKYIKLARFCNHVSFYLERAGNRNYFISTVERWMKR